VPKYDLAVVGAGLGGLAVAALAAKRGKKTIILEQDDCAGGVLRLVNKSGFAFSPGPHLSFGFEREGILHKLGEILGIALNATLLSPSYQVALPDRRITIYAEHSETLEELKREFPRDIDRITKLYRDLRAEGIRGVKSSIADFLLRRKKAGSFLRRYGFGPEFMAFLDVQSFYFYRCRAEDLSLSSLIALCDTSPYSVEDGFNRIAEQLVEVILKNGGELYYGVPFSDIQIIKERDVRISSPVGTFLTDSLLLNTEQRRRGSVLLLGIRNDVIPVAMLENVITLPDYSKIENMFSICLRDNGDENDAQVGLSTLTASFPLLPDFSENRDHMRQIARVVPFLDDFIVSIDEHKPTSRAVNIPDKMRFKPIGMHENAVLSSSSSGNIYVLEDGSGTPAGEIAAAQIFAQRARF
jgi:hypothetical protein